ncbi:MAG TPA: AAA family ATPase [Solirubrobacteraceae bacterium]|nr:AAA family ATPase [Solirubrobacteraceae bacterium]
MEERLLERDRELARIDELVADACDGTGAVLVFDGPAGIGKSALITQALRSATRLGMRALKARGGELERDFAYGVVRQLFEPSLRECSAARRRALFAGPAQLAAGVVGAPDDRPAGSAGGAPEQTFGVLHGLYWLTANLAVEGPLCIVIDDAHWSDPASQRYVLHLARRLEGLRILALLATRPQETHMETATLGDLAPLPCTHVLEPEALTPSAVGELACARLGQEPDEQFVTACHTATGGVPFFVHELLKTLVADGLAPTAQVAAQVSALAPDAVAHATLLRLSRLGPTAAAVAEAVAVLGRHANSRRIAALAGAERSDALTAVDALIGAGILEPRDPLRFAHPILRAAVYEELPRGRRSAAHEQIACLLADEGADPEEIAGHLLLTHPGDEPRVIEILRTAATAALQRGAPESAMAYLMRSASEASAAETRATLLHELARAKAVLHDRTALGDLEEALRLCEDPVSRARVALDLSRLLLFAGQWDAAAAVTHSALDELGDRNPELALELETQQAARELYDPRAVDQIDRRFELLEPGRPAARGLILILAAARGVRGHSRDEVVAMVQRGLDGGRLIADEGGEAFAPTQGISALVYVDELDRAHPVTEQLLQDGRRRGSPLGVIAGSAHRGWVEARRGNLLAAEVDLRVALELAEQHELPYTIGPTLWYCMDAILERPGLADVATLAETIEVAPTVASTLTRALLGEVRARLRLQRNDTDAAIQGLRVVGESYDAIRAVNPTVSAWRSALALALAATAPEEASRLAGEELELARSTGLPRAEGVALRAVGLLEGGERGIELLRESLAVLECAPAALERARTLVELGAILRRDNQRSAAREPLTAGLDLAHRCGAERLAQRAAEELRASGAKPRRRSATGRDALTPSEVRVARMAAEGLSNREIAHALFVTAKTVENQLGHVYQKLGISGRSALPAALGAEQRAV